MFDLIALIKVAGYAGVTGIVFAESGLLIGFFLPGDSLLFTAGFLASQGFFNIWLLTTLCFLGAIAGDSVGYSFGYRIGRKIFQREDSILFHKDNLLRAEAFYLKHGKKTIILARFLPVIRTFAPILAGVGNMPYRIFLFYNIIGALCWAVGLLLLGYFLGSTIDDVDKYLLPIIVGIITLSFLPTIFHFVKNKEDRDKLVSTGKQLWQKMMARKVV